MPTEAAMAAAPPPRPERPRTDFHRPVYCLLGLPFEQVDLPEVAERLGRAARERTRLVLSTPNVNHIVAARRDAAFRDAIVRCELIVPDGMPLVWLARLLGIRAQRVAGSDLFEALRRGAAGPLRVYFFGAPKGMAQSASARLSRDGGPLQGAGWHYPGFGTVAEMSTPDVVQSINATAADFVVVALGAAKGQQWIERVDAGIRAPILSHLGAVVNFVAGSVRRAPPAMQRFGLEWAWRIREEPALWRRYAGDGLALAGLCLRSVLPLVVRRAVRAVLPVRSSAALDVTVSVEGGVRRLALAGNWLPRDLDRLRDKLAAMTGNDAPIEIDAVRLGWVDHGFVGLLIRLYGHQHRHAQGFVIVRPSAAFARQLRWHCAEYLLAATAHRTPTIP